ncbi:conserved hypothetical protein [Talaromyces stipitatus ATCC 10500]|uniref:Uncharacterized protein n=1 Tax=Talaromyces stipitatus (strain ATCC 10500 / CBS 375.48 / QM 6759 / NRRL 1006) TaxID=441959 RepID=B8LWY8_TALSN|nr:uncharacterized protein TSTA_079760 [Talaromyces stipitatus ATCC 10500]EED24621.1 conserved hypothetical protein [Talaromyces stipitatus ATCC 10500]
MGTATYLSPVSHRRHSETGLATQSSPDSSIASQITSWKLRPGVHTPRAFITELAIIFESILVQLGPDDPSTPSSPEILMDDLRSSLSHEGRESTLPLPDWNEPNLSEMTKQAKRFAQVLAQVLYQYAAEFQHSVPGDPQLVVYSPCEGHKWVPAAGRLLRSNRSSPIPMMPYNGWLHQITCLRDALLAFENFEDVQLDFSDTIQRGTCPMESIREAFLFKIQTYKVNHSDIIYVAKALADPGLPSGGYSSQYRYGVVLPAALFAPSSSRLLRYIPTQLDINGEECVMFDFRTKYRRK